MSDLQQTWAAHVDPFTAVVDSVTDWNAPSSCEGWTGADVVAHVIESQRGFLADRGHDVPEPATGDPAGDWHAHADTMRSVVADSAVAGQEYEGAFGRSTIGDTIARFHGFDLLVHRWDLAASQGRDERFTDAELDEIDQSVDGFGDHAYGPGVFARPVPVADDADRQTKVLARTGRRG